MKKAMSLLLVLCLIFTLTACGQVNSETADTEGVTQEGSTVYELKLAHIQSAEHPNGQGAEYFARIVEEKTDGRVKVSVFPANQLGTEQEIFDSIALGTVDFGIIGFGEAAKQVPEFLLLDAPYLQADRDSWLEAMNGDAVKELESKLIDAVNVRVLGNFYYGARYMTTSNVEVHGPEDLAGHTIRVPDQDMYVNTINAMGATATPMAFSELFLALQQKVIDGQENPLATIYSNSFYEVQKYLIKTEHIIGGNCIYASEKTLNNLPEDLREIVISCGDEAAQYISNLAFEAEDTCKEQLVEAGMILIEDVDKEAFMALTDSVYDELAEKIDPELIAAIRE